MMKNELLFSKWVSFNKRNELENEHWKSPGVYAIAYSQEDLSKRDFEYNPLDQRIVYFGMSNAKAGLQGRLNQFAQTIDEGYVLHGGAERFIFHYREIQPDPQWKDKLFVSICPFVDCDVTSNHPKDLRLMGKVANAEYDCFAEYIEQ